MTADRHTPDEELQRAILADGIARLEKQLDAAEQRAREAEASASEAKSALAEVLLEKARGQKTAADSRKGRPAPVERELNSLRAELETARRDLQQQTATLEEARESAAQNLRVEYERKFHAARELMAQELQKRFADAQAALTKDAKRGESEEPPKAADDAKHTAAPAAHTRMFRIWNRLGIDRLGFAIPVAAFIGGLLLGWATLSGGSQPSDVAARQTPQVTESDTISIAPLSDAEPLLPSASPQLVPQSAPAAAPPAAEPSPPVTVAPVPAAPDGDRKPIAESEAVPPGPTDAQRALQERNDALTLQTEELRQLLEIASRRVKAAEAALSAERKKSTDLSRRAAAAELRRGDPAPPGNAAATTPPTQPQSNPRRIPRPPAAPGFFPRIE